MGIGIGTMMKLAKGGRGPEQLKEMLAAAGVDMEFSKVKPSPAAFVELGTAAALPGSELMRLSGAMKDGKRIEALLVVTKG